MKFFIHFFKKFFYSDTFYHIIGLKAAAENFTSGIYTGGNRARPFPAAPVNSKRNFNDDSCTRTAAPPPDRVFNPQENTVEMLCYTFNGVRTCP